jgi:lysophospholipase L1-like esterase
MDPISIRYLALGDSFTIGTGTSPEKAFPAVLAARWRTAGQNVELLNPAVNGYTTDDLITRELPHVQVFKPTFVTLLIGANDVVRGGSDDKRYRGQLRRIYAQLREDGIPGNAVVALPQPEWSRSPAASPYGTTEALLTRIAHFNAIAAEEAENAGARFVDLYPLMHRQAAAEMLATDGLHPNAEAHEEWAKTLQERLSPIPAR